MRAQQHCAWCVQFAAAMAAAMAVAGSDDAISVDPDLAWATTTAADLAEQLVVPGGGFLSATDAAVPQASREGNALGLSRLLRWGWPAVEASGLATQEFRNRTAAAAAAILSAPLDANTSTRSELPARLALAAAAAQAGLRAVDISGRAPHGGASKLDPCGAMAALWPSLAREYSDPSLFHDGLPFLAAPAATGLRGGVLCSGHDMLLAVHHADALGAAVAASHACAAAGLPVAAVKAALASITAALAGPLLWSEADGMYAPCSGNGASLTDVWGSALAADLGLAPPDRTARVVAWFGAHWDDVTQDGQVRMLPIAGGDAGGGGPAGQYWPATDPPIEPGTHANGGFWAAAAAWALPVVARADAAVAAQLVRDAVAAGRGFSGSGGLPEWQNTAFCCNCQGTASWGAPCRTPYPSTASLHGATGSGDSAFGLLAAASRLLGNATATGARAGQREHRSRDGQSPSASSVPRQKPAAVAAADASAADVRRPPPGLHRAVGVVGKSAAASARDGDGTDPDLAWLTQYGTLYQASAKICTGWQSYKGCFFPPAADPARPAAYSGLWTRDFEYTLEFLWGVFDADSRAVARNQTLWILGNVASPGGTNDECVFQAKLLANLANATNDKVLFCGHVDRVWANLQAVYASPADFRDNLVYSATPKTGYGFTDSIPKSGHHLFDSVLHAQALAQTSSLASRWGCGDAAAMAMVLANISAALAGPLLWSEADGMYAPCSGNGANLTDVWGSALAVDLGLAPPDRTARVVAWFGAHWGDVVQGGQVRHLAKGQHWPLTGFWEYDTYQNGGFWGTSSGWVLPVIARNSTAVAERLVRDTVADAKLHGLNEWHNNAFYSGPSATGDGGTFTPYPTHGNWFGGAMTYGPNIGSVYSAAARILGGPPPAPPTPEPSPPPKGCNLTGSWEFVDRQYNTSEVNGFVEDGSGAVTLTPGKLDAWKVAHGHFQSDWALAICYYAGCTTRVPCRVEKTCDAITCPAYVYNRRP